MLKRNCSTVVSGYVKIITLHCSLFLVKGKSLSYFFFSCADHPAAKGLLNKPFPYHDKLSYVFEKDKATRGRAETFADVGLNMPSGYEEFVHVDLNDMKIILCPNHWFNMSPEDITWPCGSKRKRGGKNLETVDVIKVAMDCQNYQLRVIAEWLQLTLEDETNTHKDVVWVLHANFELSRFDGAHCTRILMHNLADMKVFLEVSDNARETWLFHSAPPRWRLIVCVILPPIIMVFLCFKLFTLLDFYFVFLFHIMFSVSIIYVCINEIMFDVVFFIVIVFCTFFFALRGACQKKLGF